MRTLVLSLVLVLTAAGPAVAQSKPGAAAVKRAKAHLKQGKAYQEAGAYAFAVKEYQAAYDLTQAPEMLFNIGQAHRLGEDLDAALAAYDRFLEARSEGPLADEARRHVAMIRKAMETRPPAAPPPATVEPVATVETTPVALTPVAARSTLPDAASGSVASGPELRARSDERARRVALRDRFRFAAVLDVDFLPAITADSDSDPQTPIVGATLSVRRGLGAQVEALALVTVHLFPEDTDGPEQEGRTAYAVGLGARARPTGPISTWFIGASAGYAGGMFFDDEIGGGFLTLATGFMLGRNENWELSFSSDMLGIALGLDAVHMLTIGFGYCY